jgi:hypothetical protein
VSTKEAAPGKGRPPKDKRAGKPIHPSHTSKIMTDYDFLLELTVVPGKVGIWVGVGTQKAVYVKCQPGNVNRIKKQLFDAYTIIAAQGGKATPAQVRAVGTQPKREMVSYADMGLLPLVLS